MGYRVLYDNQLLFDPYTNDHITDTKLSSKLNAASYFDFTIATTHSLYSKLKERAGEVRIYFNNLILFKGEITKIDEDFDGSRSVSCTGVLDYLTATRVRPYSTIKGEQALTCPATVDGYFQWLIDQHNSNCLDSRKRFSVGVNQGNMLDKNNYIYRSSEQRPTTASEIEDKILNSVGGYLFVRYQEDSNLLDLYADVHDVNTQIIDYGVNMLDFTKTTTAESQYTAVVATGYTPDPPSGQTDAKMKPITLEGCADGITPYSPTIVKMGDRVYDVEAVNRYGYNEYYASNTDIKTHDGLLYYACKTLNTLLSPALTISVRAVDLALIMGEKYKHLLLGQAVRIRSKPRKVDEYLMVNSIDLDLMNPKNTTFDLGASYDTLTGQQSAYLKTLNASINASLDTVSALGDNVKNSAKLAQEAKDTANSATETANNASSKADTANSNATKANATANSANKTANAANDTANKANANADTANKTANAASSKADTANDTANKADTKADQAITSAGVANNTANSASSKADDAVKKAEQTQENIKVVQKSVDAANEAASNAQTAADAASTAASAAQTTADTAKTNASKAQAAADAAQSSANAANSAASKAQKSAEAANSAIADTNKEVGVINSTITQIKKDAADTRDELSGQIETVKNTMTTDYAKKTELSETEGTLRSEIETSAAGIRSEVSQNYTTKTELSNTNEKVSKAQDTANKAAAAAASNASDLTEAIKTIGKTTDDLQFQIDGSIQTWFADGEPTNLNYPAIDWTTDTIKKNHLGDLYYDNTTGYGYRWQIDQNGSYSWKRIVDTDVTKALQDAAKAQGTANSKRRIFVTTPVPPYDVADLWVQGTTGDIMRCQIAKGEGQTYAAADWIKASKYTDDTAVTKLAETVSVTYATKTTVNQLSDRIEQTVESVETVSASASAAQAAANKANDAAKAAQSTADTAKTNASKAQTSADTAKNAANAAQKAADNAKSAADTAQSAADTANADLATAKKNLEAVQNQADATDEQVAAAKAAVVKAQGAADKANTAAATAKSAADTAQSTADTAKANAATAQSKANAAASAASTAQSTADTAKANAKKAQDDVNALKNRVTKAETSIKQNSDSIALRATKTEVTNAINGISVGGRNLVLGTGDFKVTDISNAYTLDNALNNSESFRGNRVLKYNRAWYRYYIKLSEFIKKYNLKAGEFVTYSIWFKFTTDNLKDTDRQFVGIDGYNGASNSEDYHTHLATLNVTTDANVWKQYSITFKVPEILNDPKNEIRIECDYYTESDYTSPRLTQWWSSPKLELGNKPTDWSPAPEDLVSESKTYTDAQLKVTSDSITSTVSKTYATKTDLSTTNSNVTKAQSTADTAKANATAAQSTANTAKTNAATAQSAANAANSAASNAQTTANAASSAASKAQQTANAVTKDLADNYTTTVDMNSKIQQTANSIKTEVSKTYQPKGDYATNSSVRSAIEQSASSITSTVSKTYATKTSVDTLQNIADNAIESWYLVGVPSETNKPASDWTTDTLKKQHVGDMYYDKDTGYSYRWLQDGTAYKWIRIKDNDITTANAVANAAKSDASAAKTTANTAKSTADRASTTASAAQTKANEAATNATTAKSDASAAKTTANTAKSTADAASKTATAAQSTADDAATAAATAQSTANTAKTNAATAQSKANDAAKAATAAQSTADTAKANAAAASTAASTAQTAANAAQSTADTAKKNAATAQSTADTAKKNAATAQSTANTAKADASAAKTTANTAKSTADAVKNDLATNYSTTTDVQSSINQTAESIKSTVAATYVNNETISSYATKSQLEQTSTSLTSRIQTTEKTVSGMSTTVKNVDDYMTFARENNHPTLTIGSSSSSFRTKLTNTGEKFMQGDQTIMELDGITSTVKASRVQMGHYQWRDTGTSMQLVYIP